MSNVVAERHESLANTLSPHQVTSEAAVSLLCDCSRPPPVFGEASPADSEKIAPVPGFSFASQKAVTVARSPDLRPLPKQRVFCLLPGRAQDRSWVRR